MSFVWRDGGIGDDGEGWQDGEKKKKGDDPLLIFCAFFFKERETRNSVPSIVLTSLAECWDDAKIGEDLL